MLYKKRAQFDEECKVLNLFDFVSNSMSVRGNLVCSIKK